MIILLHKGVKSHKKIIHVVYEWPLIVFYYIEEENKILVDNFFILIFSEPFISWNGL